MSAPAGGGGVVAVLGAAGGCGASLLAGALALHGARAGGPAWLLDLDIDRGDRADAWDLAPNRTLADLAGVVGELDADHLRRAAHDHPSGTHLVLAPAQPGSAGEWGPGAVGRLLGAARAAAGPGGRVVADLGAGLGARARAAAAAADRTLVVCPPTLAGARRARRIADALGDCRCALVVAGPAARELAPRSLARAVGVPVLAEVPWAPREAARLAAGCWPSGRRARIAAAVAALWEAPA